MMSSMIVKIGRIWGKVSILDLLCYRGSVFVYETQLRSLNCVSSVLVSEALV